MADEQQSPEVDPLNLFSEHIREAVEGLTYLGQLSETVEFCGHSFGLRTLLPQDKFAVASAVQPWRNTLMAVDVWNYAHVAVALTHIDHDEDFCPPIGPDIGAWATARLNWVGKRLYPPVLDFLWARLALLEAQSQAAIEELDRLLQGSQPNTLPAWLDSWIAPDTSADETTSDTQPSTLSS